MRKELKNWDYQTGKLKYIFLGWARDRQPRKTLPMPQK